jgi:hypothetical protein
LDSLLSSYPFKRSGAILPGRFSRTMVAVTSAFGITIPGGREPLSTESQDGRRYGRTARR